MDLIPEQAEILGFSVDLAKDCLLAAGIEWFHEKDEKRKAQLTEARRFQRLQDRLAEHIQDSFKYARLDAMEASLIFSLQKQHNLAEIIRHDNPEKRLADLIANSGLAQGLSEKGSIALAHRWIEALEVSISKDEDLWRVEVLKRLRPDPSLRPNYPKLTIQLCRGHDPIEIPAARDKGEDCTNRLLSAVNRNQLPSGEWIRRICARIEDRVAAGRAELEERVTDQSKRETEWFIKQRDFSSPRSDEERYALELADWSERFLFHLLSLHEYQTKLRRTAMVTLEIRNEGRAPADNVTVSLVFPTGLPASIS